MGRTVNPLSFDFRGSNPLLPTRPPLKRSRGGLKFFSLVIQRFYNLWIECGSSSVGRAIAFQAIGRGFEPRLPLILGCSGNRYKNRMFRSQPLGSKPL